MVLLNPFALLFALVIGAVLLLHFRRPKIIRQVSNLHLWQTPAGESIHRRPILERIRRNWLLILQVLFLAFVVAALAKPLILLWGNPRTIVFVMDCSASMNVREGDRTRLDLAREKAIELLDEVGRNDRVLLVQNRPQPVSKTYLGSDKGAIRGALRNLSGTEAAADLSRALIMALSSVRKEESYEVYVFSDFTKNDPLSALNDRTHFIQVGESSNNAAITRLSVRSNPYSPYDQEIYAEVANFSDNPKDIQFEMSLEGTNLISEKIKLGSRERKSFAAKAPPAGRGIIQSRIDAADDLEADNRAFAVLDPRKINVLLVTEGNKFLEKALSVNPRVFCITRKPGECSEELRKGYELAILDGYEPKSLPPSNYFIIKHASAAATERGGLLHDERDLIALLPDHPILTYVNLGNVVVEEAAALQIPSSGSALVGAGSNPLMTASETGAFRNVTMGFDIRSSNLPLTLSFPVLISNIVNWLSSQAGDPGNQISAGELLRWRIPLAERTSEITITDPKGVVSRASFVNGVLTFPGTENTGIYLVRKGETNEKFAVNLFSEQESSIKPASTPASGMSHSSEKTGLARAGWEMWRVLLLVALALLALEWFHYYRAGMVL